MIASVWVCTTEYLDFYLLKRKGGRGSIEYAYVMGYRLRYLRTDDFLNSSHGYYLHWISATAYAA